MEWWQELLTVVRIDQVALAGLVTLFVWLVYSGRLNPRFHLEDARSERDAWKKAHMESEKARGILAAQNGELLELARTAAHALRSLPGGDDVAQTQPGKRNRDGGS